MTYKEDMNSIIDLLEDGKFYWIRINYYGHISDWEVGRCSKHSVGTSIRITTGEFIYIDSSFEGAIKAEPIRNPNE